MRPFFIDCDTGRDDALALWLCAAWKLPLCGVVATFGNVSFDHVYENCRRVLALAGLNDVPVWQGARLPSRPHAAYEGNVLPRHLISGNGLCDLELPEAPPMPDLSLDDLAKAIIDKALGEGPVDYFITGPASSFAALCDIWGMENTPRYINRVIMMGGKFSPLWDEMPVADFNMIADPFAVDALLASGVDVTFVPMNTSWPVFATLEELEAMKVQNTLGQWTLDLMIAHLRHFAPEPLFRFHDPCVIMAASQAGEGDFKTVELAMTTAEGPDFARLAVVPQGAKAKLYAPSEQPEVLKQIMLDALCGA